MNSPKLDNELDQYDLLAPSDEGTTALPETNLSATTQAFNNRIQRKKREQEKFLNQAERAAKQRQALMLQALMNIRRSLRDVTRIDLGERFRFAPQADDWQGWPRLTVRVVDSLRPQQDYPFLRVTAHDRQARGAIDFEYDPSQPVESLSLTSEAEIKRLPNLLKKCVRAFLDLTGDIVLEAERKVEDLAHDQRLEAKRFEENHPKEESSGLSGDVFQDDIPQQDFLETLPSLDEVQSLPETRAASGGTAQRLK